MIRTESTDPVWEPDDVCCAESAAPKVLALTSGTDQVSPHRSALPPWAMKVSDEGQPVALDLSVVPTVPPFTMRAAWSRIVPPLVFAYSQSTSMPAIVTPDGIGKPNSVHLR